MAAPTQEAIETFMSITGVTDEAVAFQRLEEHRGDLNAAVNAHFGEGDRTMRETPAAPQDDLMDVDDPIEAAPPPRRNPFSLLSDTTISPLSLLGPNFPRSLFDTGSDFVNRAPSVSLPTEVREVPIEVKDGSDAPGRSGRIPIIEDVTGTEHAHGQDVRGIVHDEDDDNDVAAEVTGQAAHPNERQGGVYGSNTDERHVRPSAPEFNNLPDYGNDIEEEMIQAAIEASKLDARVKDLGDSGPQQMQSHLEDPELAHAVSLSLKTAEQEKALREQSEKAGDSGMGASNSAQVELGNVVSSNGRLEAGGSSVQEEAEDVEEQPLVRHRSRHTSSSSMESAKDVGFSEASPPSSPGRNPIGPQHNRNAFHSDEWGGISSEEHDEAVMLEAAMFGGIPEGTGYRFAYAPHQFMQNDGPYPQRAPRPPSPSLQAQRLIREQQDDEYLASLQADREKEMKAREEAEARREQEEAARKAALEEERQKEEECRRKLEEEQELERQLAAKEASLPLEPASNNENAVTLLVRMPDGTRRGRRFLKSDKLQSLFNFIDIGKVVKPGTYRLVRPYPRRAFGDGESELTLNELGLTSKQEALFLELI